MEELSVVFRLNLSNSAFVDEAGGRSIRPITAEKDVGFAESAEANIGGYGQIVDVSIAILIVEIADVGGNETAAFWPL